MSKPHQKIGLGKGLSALLNDSIDTTRKSNESPINYSTNVGAINAISIAEIEVNPYQPRTDFEQEALHELADSIQIQGLIQPITVRKVDNNRYQLISGERRLRAATLAGLVEIPAYIRLANDQQMLEMALIENIQRENLNAIEIALSFQRMIEECSLKQEELGERVSKNRSTVTNYLRLLKLPPTIQAAIRDQKIAMGHARAIINIDNVDQQLFVLNEILKNDLSVRKVEDIVRELQLPKKHKQTQENTKPTNDIYFKKIADNLTSKIGNKVELKLQANGKGYINIPFLSNEDLVRILEIIGEE